MSDWKIRRFWSAARAEKAEGGFEIRLDSRVLRTPAKAPLVVPTLALAEAISEEWDAQDGEIDPGTMPMTRTANSAVDKVTPQKTAVADLIAEYGGSDLLCYRAEAPVALRQRQDEAWDPLVQWARDELGAPLRCTTGIIHVQQDQECLNSLRQRVHSLSPFQLAALHDLVALTGSLVLGFAATRQTDARESLWNTSRIDESWQEEQWGYDEEASAANAVRARAFLDAARFFDLCELQ